MNLLKLKKIWHDTVWSKVIAGLIVAAIIGFIGYMMNSTDPKSQDMAELSDISTTVDSPTADPAPNTPLPLTSTETHPNEPGILSSGKLPYLNNLPIIDQTLYIRYNYNDLLFGGKNLHKVTIAARSKVGSDLPLERAFSERDAIKCDITKEPRIEFMYRDRVYALDVTGSHHTFIYTLKEIDGPTMDLQSTEQYR